MPPDTKRVTHFTRMHRPELPGKGCWGAGAWVGRSGERDTCTLSGSPEPPPPPPPRGEIQSVGLSGWAFQAPAEEDARSRKNNDVCEEGRGRAGPQMSRQPLQEGACVSDSIWLELTQAALGRPPLSLLLSALSAAVSVIVEFRQFPVLCI